MENNIDLDSMLDSSSPVYLYKYPMFMVTVSVVMIVENGAIMTYEEPLFDDKKIAYDCVRFPGGVVKAGHETIQFSAIRQVKDQTGITLKIGDLMPVDFRSDPERSHSKNVVDIGMVCMPNLSPDFDFKKGSKLIPLDFEKKTFGGQYALNHKFYMDHKLLLERAIDIALLINNENIA